MLRLLSRKRSEQTNSYSHGHCPICNSLISHIHPDVVSSAASCKIMIMARMIITYYSDTEYQTGWAAGYEHTFQPLVQASFCAKSAAMNQFNHLHVSQPGRIHCQANTDAYSIAFSAKHLAQQPRRRVSFGNAVRVASLRHRDEVHFLFELAA